MIVTAQYREVGGGVITPPYRGCVGYWGAALIVKAQFRKMGGEAITSPYRNGGDYWAFFSFSACSALARVVMISSRSPSMTESMRYSVRPTRWSVTRPWGKL